MGEDKTHKESNSPGSSAGDPSLRRAIKLVTSLISISHSIRVFSSKWQSIRAKLEDLLSSIENSDSCENPSLSGEIFPAIIETVNECHDLSRRCLDLSYSGKLLMQSDLDIIGSKIDCHAKKTHLSDLTSIENSDSCENPSLSGEIFPAIIETVNECHGLSRRCLDLSYSGKLLMQSDLDIIGSKIDCHAKNLSSIDITGILKNSCAIVVSRL